ncbi:MAG: hypothetical protein KAS32_20915 [Candidatus Peribacteraceae bacterium]|nr:hypothetical protein [Candidatus Peribacteraceae bacterium]
MISEKYFDLQLINETGDLSHLDEGALSVIKEFKDGVSKTLFSLGSSLQKEGVDIKSVKNEVEKNLKKESTSISKLLKSGDIKNASKLFGRIFRISWNMVKNKFGSLKGGVLYALGIFAFILLMYLMAVLLVKLGLFALVVGTGIILTIIAFSLVDIAMSYLRAKDKVTNAFILTEKDNNKIIKRACDKLGVDNYKVIGYLSKATNSSYKSAQAYIEDSIMANVFMKKSISAGLILVVFKGIKSLSEV